MAVLLNTAESRDTSTRSILPSDNTFFILSQDDKYMYKQIAANHKSVCYLQVPTF